MLSNSLAYVMPGISTTPETIARAVSKITGIPFEIYYTKIQKREIAESRGIIFFLVRRLLKISLVEVGRPFKTDHSTVSYWEKKTIPLCQGNHDHRMIFIKSCQAMNIPYEQINEWLR